MCHNLIYLCILILNVNNIYCANILGFFSFPSISHQVVYQAIWKELSLRGHKVTVITPDPLRDPTLTNLTEIDVSYMYNFLESNKLEHIISKERSPFGATIDLLEFTAELIEREYNDINLQSLLKNKSIKFDLILLECFNPSLFAFSWIYNASMVCIHPLGAPNIGHYFVGNPTHPIVYPDLFLNWDTDELTLKQKVISTLFDIWMRLYSSYIAIHEAQALAYKYFGEDVPSLLQLQRNISMLFLNDNNVFLYPPRPKNPATISLGQIHIKPLKALPKDLEEDLDNARDGFIYFSLGTNIKSAHLPKKLKNVLIETFSQLPYKVLWKWESDQRPENLSSNVILRKWLPQQDVLGHSKIKAFVTQGGLQSIEEAISREIPFIGMPFYGDQPMNIVKTVKAGIAVSVDPYHLNSEQLKAAILEVARNKSYRDRIREVKRIVEDEPTTGLQRAVWWCEYLIRHKGASHLRSPLVDTSWWDYLLIDVLVVFILGVSIFFYGFWKIVRIVFLILSKRNKVKRN